MFMSLRLYLYFLIGVCRGDLILCCLGFRDASAPTNASGFSRGVLEKALNNPKKP